MKRFAPLVLLIAACACEAAPPPAYTTRDSAGIRIVEYAAAPAGSRALSIPAAPVYRVGDEPGEREFSFVGLGILEPDGSAVVVDGQGTQEVVRIGPDGSTTLLAKAGQGPGEVRAVNGLLALGGDTVLVQDYANRRMSIFAGDSLTAAVDLSPLGREAMMIGPVGRDGSRTALMVTTGFALQPQEGWMQGRMMRLDLNSVLVDTVAAYDLAKPGPDPRASMNPFGPFGSAVASGSVFVTGRSDISELTWRGSDGPVRQIVRWKVEPTYPTDSDLAALLDRMGPDLARVNPRISKEDLDRLIASQRERMQLVPGEPFPIFGLLEGDGLGGLWLSDYSTIRTPLASPPRWAVITPDGEWLGSVVLPDRFRVLDVRGNRVLGVLSDSMDVQSVAVFEVSEGGAR